MELYGNAEQQEDIDHLEKWFEDNKKLPNKIDRVYLARFYHRAARNIDETKKLLQSHFELRNKNPEIYSERDPNSQDAANTKDLVYFTIVPGMTPANERISVIALKNTDPNMLHFTKDLSTYIMVCDCRFSIPDEIQDGKPLFADGGVIQILDMKGITMKHMAKLSLATLHSFLKYLQQVSPVAVKSVHIINCPTYINNIYAVVKPFLNKQFVEMIHFHKNGIDTLYDHMPRGMLPDEYGGSAGKISDLSDDLIDSVREKRDYVMDPNYWKMEKKSSA